MSQTAAAKDPPWHAAFPAPRTTSPAQISRDEVRNLFVARHGSRDAASSKVDFILVDLRRMDHEGGTISTSINLPAQSLYPSIPTLFGIFKNAGVRNIIWYCGASQGRGPRAAGWFADYIDDQKSKSTETDIEMASHVLTGGIKGWVAGGQDFTTFMDEYVAEKWTDV